MDNKSLETQAHSLLGSILSSANPKIVIKCYFWYFGIKTFKLNNKKRLTVLLLFRILSSFLEASAWHDIGEVLKWDPQVL